MKLTGRSALTSEPVPEVDILILCRPATRPPSHVMAAIESQRGVRVRVHIEEGCPHPSDKRHWETIARARTRIKRKATATWAMFVDDDVLLHHDCIRVLLNTLIHSPTLGAIAADSDGDQLRENWAGHVGMAACLFRRSVLDELHFRSEEQACECWCCAADMRQAGWGIAYCADARAVHLRDSAAGERNTDPGVVLAAFDRRDIKRFRDQFLRSLRHAGNDGLVVAATYGLYPSELRQLQALPGVRVVPKVANGVMAPVRRLQDFAEITGQLPANTPVAYWDVADVVFQQSLNPLWRAVQRQPDQILAVIEPKSYPDNAIIPAWSLSVHDPLHCQRVFELLQRNGFLNSGFAAGIAASMHAYFARAWELRWGPELNGTSDWGDQMCLNLYCHSHPERWTAVHEGWNFCLHDRPEGEIRVLPRGTIWSQRIGKVPVAHGNARSLRQYALPTD